MTELWPITGHLFAIARGRVTDTSCSAVIASTYVLSRVPKEGGNETGTEVLADDLCVNLA